MIRLKEKCPRWELNPNPRPSQGRVQIRYTSRTNTVDLMGVEPITPILQGSVAASGMEAQNTNQ